MTRSAPPLSRHDLAWLAPRWRDLLCGSPGAEAVAAAERWTERRLPAVVARSVAGDGAGVRLGIPCGRGREGQASVVVAREAIARASPPLRLSAAVASAPAPWRARLRALDEDARAVGLVVRTYGSLAWQHLTGEARVTATTSDADLLVAVSDAPALERALTLLRRHDLAGAPRLDGEVVLPGGRGVAWRELLGPADRLIVKSARSVVLGSRVDVLASLGVEETVDEEAIAALEDELRLEPKPGLVGPRDRGAHPDMDAGTFIASLDALRGSFRAAALAGRRRAPFRILRAIGVGAERRMLRATGGVNTHRGAIFSLGLLAAAAGRAASWRGALTREALRDEARGLSGELRALPRDARSNGARAAARHRVGGARGEAEAAFPHVFEVALPALDRAVARGAPAPAARIEALMELIAVLPDTNLLHRGGAAGLAFARAAAREFLAAGGVHRARWEADALEMHRAFVARRLSPGGSADLLAAALFVERVCGKGAVP